MTGERDVEKVGQMETIYVVCHHTEYGKRHYPIAAYRREVDAINERNSIDHHTSGGSVVVDKVTLDGAVSQDLKTGRNAYHPRDKVSEWPMRILATL